MCLRESRQLKLDRSLSLSANNGVEIIRLLLHIIVYINSPHSQLFANWRGHCGAVVMLLAALLPKYLSLRRPQSDLIVERALFDECKYLGGDYSLHALIVVVL
jgi:hypothetical protein